MPGNHRPVAAVATMRFPSWDISVVPMRARLCSLFGEGEIGGLSWPQNISLDDVAEPIAAVVPWLKRWHKRGAAIASACSGGWAWSQPREWLDGKRATTHWALAERFRNKYPKVRRMLELMVTEDRGFYCGGGVRAPHSN